MLQTNGNVTKAASYRRLATYKAAYYETSTYWGLGSTIEKASDGDKSCNIPMQGTRACDELSVKDWKRGLTERLDTQENDRLENWYYLTLKWLETCNPVAIEIDSRLFSEFITLKNEWLEETTYYSSIIQITMNQYYQRIIGLGPDVIPLILFDLKTNGPNHWFWALTALTGEDPITPEIAGDMDKMTQVWLKLGELNGWIKMMS